MIWTVSWWRLLQTISGFDTKNKYIEYESKGDKQKVFSVKKYIDMIRPYLSNMINGQKTQEEWKV